MGEGQTRFDIMRRDASFFRVVVKDKPAFGFKEALEAFAADVPALGLRALHDGEMLIVRQSNSDRGNAWLVEARVPAPTFEHIGAAA